MRTPPAPRRITARGRHLSPHVCRDRLSLALPLPHPGGGEVPSEREAEWGIGGARPPLRFAGANRLSPQSGERKAVPSVELSPCQPGTPSPPQLSRGTR